MKLDDYDFKEVGEWCIYDRVKSGIIFHLTKFEDERVIYAFVVNEEVKYLGICEEDTTTLKDRLNRYKFRMGGNKSRIGKSTNERVAGKIKECLEKDNVVKIYALKSELKWKYKDLDVDLVKGLENPLIEKFKPEWNIGGINRRSKQT